MKPRQKKFPAESLIETIIAITVITLAVSAAMGLLRTSILGNNIIGSKLVAINLAQEGLEAVRNVRDTNYLRFASDPDNCWNKLNITDVSECQPAASPDEISEGVTYYLYRDFSGNRFEWELRATDLTDTGDVDFYEVDTDQDGSFETNIYAQEGWAGIFTNSLVNAAYNRTIVFRYISPDAFIASVTVDWVESGLNKSITLSRTISHVY